jgi:hypothetical protein
MSEVVQSDGVWLSNRQAWELLGVSKATFYRKYYPELMCQPATRWLSGHPRYQRPQLEALLKSDRPITQPAISTKSAALPEGTPGLTEHASDHNVVGPKPLFRRRTKPHKAGDGDGQLVLLEVPEAP